MGQFVENLGERENKANTRRTHSRTIQQEVQMTIRTNARLFIRFWKYWAWKKVRLNPFLARRRGKQRHLQMCLLKKEKERFFWCVRYCTKHTNAFGDLIQKVYTNQRCRRQWTMGSWWITYKRSSMQYQGIRNKVMCLWILLPGHTMHTLYKQNLILEKWKQHPGRMLAELKRR